MSYHAKDQLPLVDPQTQALFDQGNQVGNVAKRLFPDGIEITGSRDYQAITADALEALKERKPLYEAGFKHKNTYARADILSPHKSKDWELTEVKSTTQVKDVHVPDVGFQKYCYEGAGVPIKKVFLLHINNEYELGDEIDPEELFAKEDITDLACDASKDIEGQVDSMVDVLNQKKCPEVKIGPHCTEPYECPLKSKCWSFLPEQNVFTLNRIRKQKAFELLNKGIHCLDQIDDTYPLSPSQRIQKEAFMKKERCINPSGIKSFIDALEFPIYFLDFETVGGPIPFYKGTRPYQQVPFQYSLHILRGWGADPEHHGFLAEGKDDPRPELLKGLESLIGKKGTILSYNMSFELSKLRDSVNAYPEYAAWFAGIERRFMDLIVPFRAFDYYDCKQVGRTSIKLVYPALTGGSYEGMGISEGGAASAEYARVTFGETSEADRQKVRNDLEEYCKLDTLAMIQILDVLRESINSKI